MILNNQKLLWLDDIRDPGDTTMDWLRYSPIEKDAEVVWVKNFKEFKEWIEENALPDAICFDHDLGEDEPSGYDCALWLIDYCLDHQSSLPLWGCQSANPVGKENINKLFQSFLRNIDFE